MKKFRLTCTHNPQDLFNGIEPFELMRSYESKHLERDVDNELRSGYTVIIDRPKPEEDSHADV